MVISRLTESWREVLASLPPSVGPAAKDIAVQIGIGATWEELVTLTPNQQMPWYAADDRGVPILSDERLERFVIAHHRAGFFGLLADRLTDRQATATHALLALRRHLLHAWVDALAEALGHKSAALRVVARSLRAWRRGVRLERSALASGVIDGRSYATVVALKLAWVSATSVALVEQFAPSRALAFAEAGRLFLAALQCRDDAIDAEEDSRIHGCDVAKALRLTRGALFRAAPRLVARAADVARRARFDRFAAWLDDYRPAIDVGIDEGFGPHHEMGGWILAEAIA